MTVTIIPIVDHESYSVNGRVVYKDYHQNWISAATLSQTEIEGFIRYEGLVINNLRFKKHIKSTFKT